MRQRCSAYLLILIFLFSSVALADESRLRICKISGGYRAECDGETVYLAAYTNGRLSDISYGDSSAYLPDIDGAVYRAYTWGESLKPTGRAADFGTGILFADSFEKYSDGKAAPDGWNVYDWGKNSGISTGFGMTDDCSDGEYSVYINALDNGYGGFLTQLPIRSDAPSYEISLDVKTSADYSGNYPKIWFLLYNGSDFVSQIDSTPIKGQITQGEWSRVQSVLTADALSDYEFDDIRIVIGTVSDGAGASGNVKFDNLTVTSGYSVSRYAACDIRADKYAAWYTLGDTVMYKPEAAINEDIKTVTGVIYNSENKNVFSNTISAKDFENSGFLYTPSDVGYYEAEFLGTTYSGKKVILTDSYTDYADGYVKSYELERRSFAVVKSAAKPMSERSSKLLFVSSGSGDELSKAELVGFSGIKCSFSWGDTAVSKGFHTSPGSFDWRTSDGKFERIADYGYKTVIAGVGSTPPWAAPADISGTDVNIAGKWYKNLYAPVDNAYTAEGISAFAERYSDRISAMEFWNEPYYGEAKTAYWYDTTDNFVNMNKAAYDAFKSAAPDKMFISAGFFGNTSGSVYLNDLLKYDNYKNSFDMISFHGRYNIVNDYKNVLRSNGLSDIPFENSECYAYGLFGANEKKEYAENDMYLAVNYLNQLKEGVSHISLFEINDLNPDEQRLERGGHAFGLFRKLPSSQPHRGAVVAYNLFDVLSDSSEYRCEYSFGSQKAVRFDDNGNSVLFVWNSDNSNFSLCSELRNAMGIQTVVKDFEGRSCDIDNLKNKTMYIITLPDEEAIGQLTPCVNGALNNKFVSPFYTCRTDRGTDGYMPDSGVITRGNLFDKTSFAKNTFLAERTNNIKSVESSASAGKFEVSVGYDGLYVSAAVNDATDVSNASSPEELQNYDSIAFALDCYGNLRENEVNEYRVGIVDGIPVVYKYRAADIYEALSDDISPGKTVLENATVNIVRSDKQIRYDVFVPFVELFPSNRLLETEKIRFSLAVYDNDGTKSSCSGRFGEGLATDCNVKKFGCLSFGGAYAKVSADKITINGYKPKNSGKIMLTVYGKDGIRYIMQYDDISDGKFSVDIPQLGNGDYTVNLRDDAGNRYTVYLSI